MSSPAITLYFKPGSCSLVAHALLHHLSLPFKPVPMKPNAERRFEAADGSFSHQDYLKINPSGFVPALVIDGGEVITELPAVLTYIACVAPPADTEKLLGNSALSRAKIVEWMTWLSGTFQGTGVAACARPYRFADGEEAKKAVAEKGWDVVLSCYARVEDRLKGREFAVGEALTVVDLYLYVFRRWAIHMTGLGGSDFGNKFPQYEKLGRLVESLEGVQKTLQLEDLKPVYE
ncbi:glutathione S-transferase GST-6.0 [Colletotrichum spaethianum]|uniref:Glutathione S-transferase GST-6.0 n=1 Tax=Colletotrichum spaethianum TaxID=700344 RepID=A0AA37PE23_9PEZI|nr:glutathione S-transferase GST-6.0 [Colletotrichum spaethianum]GKT50497.1 glutathione S-transferase GST-6.0 [Colletotrichum spaethianum]